MSPAVPCYLVPLGHKYLPQHNILEHPQTTFFLQCERSSFKPVHKLLLLLLLLLYHNKHDVRSSAQNNLPDAIHNSVSACFNGFLTRETVNFVTCSNGLTSDKVNFTCKFVTIMNTLSGMGKDGRMEKAFHH